MFVAFRLHEYWRQIDLRHFGARTWLVLTALALCYGAANVLLARAWWRLLAFLDTNAYRHADLAWAVRTYGATQLAKYVPGNIAQFAGRQVLALDAGLKGTAVAMSAVWEMGLLSTASLFFAVLASPLLFPMVSAPVSLLVFGGALALATLGTLRWWGVPVACALLEHAVFLAVSGAVFTAALALTAPNAVDGSLIPVTCGAYALAWLAGLLTPGAPAGAGVREAALVFLLSGRVAPAELLVAALFARIAMVAGDVAFFGATSLPLFWKRAGSL